ncbi:hypothetical protein TH66_10605 [Carbonactinospora thermoautotrophica]|uniref:Pyrrolo-quinoline quinone repeat domain-containing protein n=2 Tax=Carbonactinospora thermoautotrophica TaxID=1469144 RepID=A0A132MZY2_9ACTN|nr:PQQ-binding-like beta-propeller repeat protein [Carbonactinospora thermoautotrophica]KWX03383.1 hypothetical protein TH66_10605 [Carbonactinospora thermoautotrophica]
MTDSSAPPAAPAPPAGPAPAAAPGGPARPEPPRLAWVAAALAAYLAVLGGVVWGVWAALRGAADRQVLWSLPYPDGTGPDDRVSYGSWLTGQAVVRGQPDGVVAYDLETGRRLWGVPVPGPAVEVCALSPTAEQGVGAVAYGERCDQVMAVDVAGGRKLWSTRLHTAGDGPSTRVFVVAGTVIAQDTTGVRGLALDGAPRWRAAYPKGCAGRGASADPARVVVLIDCGRSGSALAFDPRSGRLAWRAALPVHPEAVLAAAPVIVQGDDALVVLDDTGRVRSRIPREYEGNELDLEPADQRRHKVLVHGDTLLAVTEAVESGGSNNAVVAYDLRTGSRRWASEGAPEEVFALVSGDDQGVLAVIVGGHGERARLVRFSLDDGTRTDLDRFTRNVAGAPAQAMLYEQDGRFLIVPYQDTGHGRAIIVLGRRAGG